MKQEHRFRQLLALVLPTLLVLTACEAHSTFTVEEGGTVNLEMQLQDDSGLMETAGINCDSLKSEITSLLTAENNADIEIIDNSSTDMLDCTIRAHSQESAIDGQTLIESGDTYTLKLESMQNQGIPAENLHMLKFLDNDFTFTVQMPGEIVRADGAQISGNQAVYSDLETLLQGIEVEGKKTADAAAVAQAAQTNLQHQNARELSWAAIIGIIAASILVFTVVLTLVLFLVRRRKNKQRAANPFA